MIRPVMVPFVGCVVPFVGCVVALADFVVAGCPEAGWEMSPRRLQPGFRPWGPGPGVPGAAPGRPRTAPGETPAGGSEPPRKRFRPGAVFADSFTKNTQNRPEKNSGYSRRRGGAGGWDGLEELDANRGARTGEGQNTQNRPEKNSGYSRRGGKTGGSPPLQEGFGRWSVRGSAVPCGLGGVGGLRPRDPLLTSNIRYSHPSRAPFLLQEYKHGLNI